MIFQNVFTLLLVLMMLVCICNTLENNLVEIDPLGDKALSEASFALKELQKLSDSTIYSTLTLNKILSAKEQVGVFHYNTILQIELSSPYFRSGKASETFEVIVMEHIEDHLKSFAIDEFPDMDEVAIENFWIRKVGLKRKFREEAFRRLEIESILLGEEPDKEKLATKDKLDKNSVNDLLSVLDTPLLLSKRQSESTAFQQRLKEPALLAEEKILADMSLEELFVVTQNSDVTAYSDFQKYRAKQMLDVSMQELQLQMAAIRD